MINKSLGFALPSNPSVQPETLKDASRPVSFEDKGRLRLDDCKDQLAFCEAAISQVRLSIEALLPIVPLPPTSPTNRQLSEGPNENQSEDWLANQTVRPSGRLGGRSQQVIPSVASLWATRDSSIPKTVDQVVLTALSGTPGRKANPTSQLTNTKDSYNVSIVDRDIVWSSLRPGWPRFIPMLHPESKIKLSWLILGFCFIVYEAFAIPVYLAFDVDPEGFLYLVVSLVNTYFLLDIIVHCLSCYMDRYGSIIHSPWRVVKGYAKSWLVFDVIAGIPWEWIDQGDAGLNQLTRSVRLIRAARMLRLIRVVRIMKLKSVMDNFDTHIEANFLYMFLAGVLRICVALFAMCHWGACVWYSIGKDPGEGDSWVTIRSYDSPTLASDHMQHYTYSLYFVLTTMTTVGYGDITPISYDEVRFCMLLLMFSSVVFAGLMGTLTDMISALNSQRHELQEKKMMLSRYMRWRAVPRKLTMSIRQHLLFLWEANKGYDAYEEVVKQQLPPVLKAALCNHIYGKVLQTIPFLGWMRDYPICVKFLAEQVHSLFLEMNDCLFRMGQPNEQIYVLLTGSVVASRNEALFSDEDEDLDQNLQSEELSSRIVFDIPRNNDEMQVGKNLPTARLHRNIAMKFSSGNGQKSDSSAQSSKETSPTRKLSSTTGNEFFDAEAFFRAGRELRQQDDRMKKAVTLVQRRWREKLNWAAANVRATKSEQSLQRPMEKLQVSRMTSRTVQAPAYFGESCLWQPVEEWSAPVPYLYTARCLSRVELVFIPRTVIKEALDRFSPWLRERLDIFREGVIKSMENFLGGDDVLRKWHAVLPKHGTGDMEREDSGQARYSPKRTSSESAWGSVAKPRDSIG